MGGGHGVPKEKIVARYEKALGLVKDLIPVCDVCHIYDNSEGGPYRIFKKRKDLCWYCTEPHLWLKADITALTGIRGAEKAALNSHKQQEAQDTEIKSPRPALFLSSGSADLVQMLNHNFLRMRPREFSLSNIELCHALQEQQAQFLKQILIKDPVDHGFLV